MKRSYKAYLFLFPLFFFLLLFSYYPAISGIYHSFFNWKDTGEATFIGFENFRRFFFGEDAAVFWNSCLTMLILMIPKLIINIFVPLVVAELIFNLKSDKGKSLYRLWVLIPMVAPGVVTTLIWQYIYDPRVSRRLAQRSVNGDLRHYLYGISLDRRHERFDLSFGA